MLTERVQRIKRRTNLYVFIVKNTFAERNKTFCDKTLNKCIANAFFSYFVTLIILLINIESVLYVGYLYEVMNCF